SSAPIIVVQPTNVFISIGAAATFTISAIGNLPLAYQWRSNGFNLADSGNFSGSSSSALTIRAAREGNNRTYSVLVSNAVGSALSTGAVLTVSPVSAPGTRLATLYSFAGNNNGGTPNGLVVATNGILYGTTQFGGAANCGTVFSISTNGAVTAPLVSFSGINGLSPRAALIQGADGYFYGTTPSGGTNFLGNVFRMSSSGTLTNLYSFSGNFDGSNPYAPLLQASNGNFYGFATSGGTNGYGTVFRINSNGTFTALYSFNNGIDDSGPTAGLIQGSDGYFYGVNSGGGFSRMGRVYRLRMPVRPTDFS